nr:hypothetical protein [Actinomycetota bacterium]
MSELFSDAGRFRRLVAGFCLIIAPVVLLVGALTHPQGKEAAAAHLAVVAENPDRYYWAHAILLLGLALFLPVVLALMHLLKERETRFGHLGGGLAIIGLFGATAVVAVDGIAVSQMGQPQASIEEMAALLDRIKESPGFRGIAVVAGVGLMLGMVLLAYGLWRTRAVQPWMAGGVASGAITFFLGVVTDNRIIFAMAFAIDLIALGPLGWGVLHESDNEWSQGGVVQGAQSPSNEGVPLDP